jgi:hypothetical protein
LAAIFVTAHRFLADVGDMASGKRKYSLMNDIGVYPVPGRSALRNARICAHEIGHAFITRALGNSVHSVTAVRGENFEGRCIRSGPASELTFDDNPEAQTEEIISVCDRLARMQPELGSGRIDDAEFVVRGQSMVIELVAGRIAEEVLFPDQPSLGAVHDDIEANAFARVCVAAQPAVRALISYCESEARAMLHENIDIVRALVEALILHGTLSGAEVDAIISAAVTARAMAKERARRVEWARALASAEAFSLTVESVTKEAIHGRLNRCA